MIASILVLFSGFKGCKEPSGNGREWSRIGLKTFSIDEELESLSDKGDVSSCRREQDMKRNNPHVTGCD